MSKGTQTSPAPASARASRALAMVIPNPSRTKLQAALTAWVSMATSGRKRGALKDLVKLDPERPVMARQHQLLAIKVAGRDPGLPGQPVPVRQDHVGAHLDQIDQVKRGMRCGRLHETHVHPARSDGTDHLEIWT